MPSKIQKEGGLPRIKKEEERGGGGAEEGEVLKRIVVTK